MAEDFGAVKDFGSAASGSIEDFGGVEDFGEPKESGSKEFLKQKWNEAQGKHKALLEDGIDTPLGKRPNPLDMLTGPVEAGWNFLAGPLLATVGAVGGAVVEGAQGNNPLYALADYFKKTAESVHVPENKVGEFISTIIATPFEAIQKAGEAAGDPVYEGLWKAGFKDEVAAGAGAAVQGLVNLAGMAAVGKGVSKAFETRTPKIAEASLDSLLAEPVAKDPLGFAPEGILEGLPKNSKQMLYPGQKPYGPREPSQFELALGNSPETASEMLRRHSPQEDLFSTETAQGIQKYEVLKKAGETDQAYAQREAAQRQEAADVETRRQLDAIPDEAIDASLPAQSSARMPRGVGVKQGGAVLPDFLSGRWFKEERQGELSTFKNPIHLKDGTRLSGFNDRDQTVFHGYDKNGERITLRAEFVKPDDITWSKDSNRTAEAVKSRVSPLGGPGKKQGGAIGFKPKPKTLEERAKHVTFKDWEPEFAAKYPQHAGRAKEMYNKLEGGTKLPSVKTTGPSSTQDVLGLWSGALEDISPRMFGEWQKLEMNVLQKPHESISKADPFLTAINKVLPAEQLKKMNSAMLQNNTRSVQQISKEVGIPELGEMYARDVRGVLQDIGQQLVETGRLEPKQLLPDYFPRVVKDLEGMYQKMGIEQRTALEKNIKDAQTAAKKKGIGFDELDQAKVINDFLRARPQNVKPGYSKSRTFDEIPKELEEFFFLPTETFHSYVNRTINDIEVAKFFGKSAVRDPQTRRLVLDDSIGNKIQQELNNGNLKPEDVGKFRDLLETRLGPGARSVGGKQEMFRGITNLTTIGNITSGLKQSTDIASSVYATTLRDTLNAVSKQVTGKAPLSAKDMGFLNHISEEFIGQRGITKAVNAVHRGTSFSFFDMAGKSTLLNATLLRNSRLAKTPKGRAELAEIYEAKLGKEDFQQLMKDYQSGKRTALTDLASFMNVARMQPISRAETASFYMRNPDNGLRLLYQLKQWGLKQGNVLWREGIREIKNGVKEGNLSKTKKGMTNLARYTLIMGAAGASADQISAFLFGRDKELAASSIPLAMMKTFYMHEYTKDKLKRGRPTEAVAAAVHPATRWIDDLFTDIYRATDRDPETEIEYKSVRNIPIAGNIVYERFLGGAEKANERREEKEMAD